jgi:hypothetical protein
MWQVWGRREVHTDFGGETRGKGKLGRHRRCYEDNIKMSLQEIGRGEGRGGNNLVGNKQE